MTAWHPHRVLCLPVCMKKVACPFAWKKLLACLHEKSCLSGSIKKLSSLCKAKSHHRDFFGVLRGQFEKKNPNLKKKKKIFFFQSFHSVTTPTQATWRQSTIIATYFPLNNLRAVVQGYCWLNNDKGHFEFNPHTEP